MTTEIASAPFTFRDNVRVMCNVGPLGGCEVTAQWRTEGGEFGGVVFQSTSPPEKLPVSMWLTAIAQAADMYGNWVKENK